MEFALNETQKLFKNTAQKVFKEKCTITNLKEMEETEGGHSPELYKYIAELGFLGLIIPEEYGGVGGDLLDLALVVEEAGWAALSGPFISTLSYGVLPLLKYGTEEQKNELLPKIASGEVIITAAFSEAQAHYDMEYVCTSAVDNQKEGYSLSGTKLFVPHANSADYILTLARTGKEKGKDGLSLFIIESNLPGVQISSMPSIGSDALFEVEFSGVNVDESAILGAVGEGYKATKNIIQHATALQAIEMSGILQRAVDVTNEYVKERMQFGRAIGTFQAVQHRLSDMLTVVEGGKLTAYHAIWKLNEGLEAETEVATAKAFLSKEGQNVLVGAHQLHGGMGIDFDYPLQFCFRRFKSKQVDLGSAAIHLETIAKELPISVKEKTLV